MTAHYTDDPDCKKAVCGADLSHEAMLQARSWYTFHKNKTTCPDCLKKIRRRPDPVFSLSWATPFFMGMALAELYFKAPFLIVAFSLLFCDMAGRGDERSVDRERVASLLAMAAMTLTVGSLRIGSQATRELTIWPIVGLVFTSVIVKQMGRKPA